jgi:hypothetical protein
MAKPSEKLAQSLQVLRDLQDRGIVAIRARDLTRTHKERLLANGFLEEVMKGWYIPARPDDRPGESTAWYAGFWDFARVYLKKRFNDDWCLSPEQSLQLHIGKRSVPTQLLVRAPKARNKLTGLAHETSLLEIRAALPPEGHALEIEDMRVFSLPSALVACGAVTYRQNPTDMRTALSMVRDASELLSLLLDGGHSTIAGRLAGALRNIGRDRMADDIVKTMRAAGYDVRESDPFGAPAPFAISVREISPYVNRMKLMWQAMREDMTGRFPAAPGLPRKSEAFLKAIDDVYVTDAYHSLSIEGYQVTPELIERVRRGDWNPDKIASDGQQRDALAARGYFQAFQAVKTSVAQVLKKDNPGQVADHDHGTWYREMFAPSVTAGILRPADLAGYRNDQVYIRRSMHVPPKREAVRDLMPVLFECLRDEADPAVRVVLGHFMFVYIHPYMDGNGRMGRLLMNVMLAAGGYPWTVIPLEKREDYMAALENAGVNQNITPFTEFLRGIVELQMHKG